MFACFETKSTFVSIVDLLVFDNCFLLFRVLRLLELVFNLAIELLLSLLVKHLTSPISYITTSNAMIQSTQMVQALKVPRKEGDPTIFKEITMLEGEENLTCVDLIDVHSNHDVLKASNNGNTITNAQIGHNFGKISNYTLYI
jgi:hypothetical protein